MTFLRLASYLQKLERTTSRNEITAILSGLFKEAKAEEIDKICYLCLGRLAPKYEGIEFNLAEKTMAQVLSKAYEKKPEEIKKLYKKMGDLGEVASELAPKLKVKSDPFGKTQGHPEQGRTDEKLKVIEVFERLYEIATTSGEGSVEKKIGLFAKLLCQLGPLSAKFIVRIPLGKLRLGFSDVTILDALSWSKTGDKSLRPQLERAYNICADIGKIAKIFKKKGIGGVKKVKAMVGTPIRTAQAERLPSAEKIIEKLGRCASEKKFDGFRTQIHIWQEKGKKKVRIFSRNLENITQMFPDIVGAAQKIKVKSAVLDGEAIGYNPQTGEFLPFQETVQRKRKYGIKEKAKEVPLKVFVFDLLFLNGKDLIFAPFSKRRRLLEGVLGKVKPEEAIQLAEQQIISTPKELRQEFDLAISEGLEGLVLKKLDSVYQAGARNFNWVKYKRTTEGELADTVDCLVLGYYRGRGKRAGFGIGAFLTGVYDEASEKFFTIAKIGTGLSDEQWKEMKKKCDEVKVEKKPEEYVVDKNLFCDVWVRPMIVVEIKADEITRSPVHTAGKTQKESGFALRFPRLVRFRDKDPEQATTVKEVLRLYEIQGR